VETLHPDDFVITEDGKPQTISVFEFQKLSGVPQGTKGVQSYYIAGYYTTNQMLDDQYRKVAVKLRNDSGYKVDYRAGYYSGRPGATGIGPAVRTEISKNFGPGFVSPILISKTDPQYSEQARKAKYSGSVILSVDVDASGEVIGTHLIRPLGMGLDEKAVEAVTQWKFRPGTKDGKPVPMQVQLEVNFRLL
jgi:TonB family protein